LPRDYSPALGESRKRSVADQKRFLSALLRDPRRAGAVAPSSHALARAMARFARKRDGLVVELGPGTGPVTQALLESGVPREKLVLIEYDVNFCRLLESRFPGVRVLRGDAFRLAATLSDSVETDVAAVVSSLPLLNEPPPSRARLLDEAFSLMGAAGVFVQFTYGLGPPIRRDALGGRYTLRRRASIWGNLPPAHVWVYESAHEATAHEPVASRLREKAAMLLKGRAT